MKVGIFTDTYFPQVSGVATSTRTLKDNLEAMGHEVYIFTTTDPNSQDLEDLSIIRLPSVPFISFTDRRVVMRGMRSAYLLAKKQEIDIVHTQTEFGVGMIGKHVAKQMDIPIIHTLHTKYEDYVHYIAKGKIIHPGMIKYLMRAYLSKYSAVICPSKIVYDTTEKYGIKIPRRVIPTGIELGKFVRPDIGDKEVNVLREKLGISNDETMLLSLSRISYEKNIQAVIKAMPNVLEDVKCKLIIVGDGPHREELEKLVDSLDLVDKVIFVGMVDPKDVALYYKASDFFISASTSETQGLTYTESLAAGTPIIASDNPYLHDLVDNKMFGHLFTDEEDLAEDIKEAISSTPKMEEARLESKLFEISAENFAQKVYEFYVDTIISHGTQKSLKKSKLASGKYNPKKIPRKLVISLKSRKEDDIV
jgi:Glycosyltransferase